ncbi:hypothetical protein SUDANB6_05638 [Streptomyces sp. enrichment culture]
MNPDPDHSAAYAVLRTDAADAPEGHGFAFAIGRGNDVQVAAVEALRGHVVGRSADVLCAGPACLYRDLTGDGRLRRPGPGKGVAHMAVGAVVNAVRDLAARRARKPPWRLPADAEPERLVGRAGLRYLTDILTPEDALDLLRRGREGAGERRARLLERGYPAYTTSPGWLGCDDAKPTRLTRRAVADGFTRIEPKVGYVDHLHDPFHDPVVIRDGHYTAPSAPGFPAALRPEPVARYAYPGGAFRAAGLAERTWKEQTA